MNLCIPVMQDSGLQSPVCPHFGSTPCFVIVDTDSGACRAIRNANAHHEHGRCAPLSSLQGERIDAMVVGGIGMGALNRLSATGISVFQSQESTVEAALRAFRAGTLRRVTTNDACTDGHSSK